MKRIEHLGVRLIHDISTRSLKLLEVPRGFASVGWLQYVFSKCGCIVFVKRAKHRCLPHTRNSDTFLEAVGNAASIRDLLM